MTEFPHPFPLCLGAHGEAARLRRRYRRVIWDELRGRVGTARAAAAVARAPIDAARQALGAVRRLGRAVREAHGVGVSRQFAGLWWATTWHGIGPEFYYRHQLYYPDRRRQAATFLQPHETSALRKRLLDLPGLREASWTIGNKRRFAAWCAEHGLPALENLMVFENGEVVHGTPDGSGLPPADLFSKRISGHGGNGAACWRFADGRYGHTERRYTPAELVAELTARSASRSILLQRCATNHPTLAPFGRNALTTLRVVTCRPPDGPPSFVLAAYRLTLGDGVVDNYSAGGAACFVDPATGELGPALRQDPAGPMRRYARHPLSGAPIEGTRIPHWPEIVPLALRAHGLLGTLATVGWDVAVTPDGPLIVEGNWNDSPRVPQLTSGRGLGETVYARCLNEWMRLVERRGR
jgi:hypothetical protein